MTLHSKMLMYGGFTWLVPFIVSFFFFDMRARTLVVDETFFKTIMIVTSAFVGTLLLVLYFKRIEKRFVFHGIVVGVVWLVINWLLDLLLVWRGMYELTYRQYFQEIGLRYLMIPIQSVGVGYLLQVVSGRSKKEVVREVLPVK